jgi:tetratricopeptide (TPR) repeat protein
LLFTRVQVQYWQNSLTLFKHAVEMTENNFRMHNNYGKALMVEGHFDDAIEHFKEILKINPQYFKAQNNLGLAYYMKGEIEQAITYFDKALQLKPEWVGPMQNLAWIKATQPNPKFRDPREAVRLAERACELTDYKNPALLDTLAVAYAAVGKFPEAVATAKKALELAESSGHS